MLPGWQRVGACPRSPPPQPPPGTQNSRFCSIINSECPILHLIFLHGGQVVARSMALHNQREVIRIVPCRGVYVRHGRLKAPRGVRAVDNLEVAIATAENRRGGRGATLTVVSGAWKEREERHPPHPNALVIGAGDTVLACADGGLGAVQHAPVDLLVPRRGSDDGSHEAWVCVDCAGVCDIAKIGGGGPRVHSASAICCIGVLWQISRIVVWRKELQGCEA